MSPPARNLPGMFVRPARAVHPYCTRCARRGLAEATDVGLDIIAEVSHVQGVVAVRDRLSYPSGDPHVPDPLF